MKKIIAIGLVLMFGCIMQGYAGTTDTCAMSVTVTTSKDVTVTNDPLAFGSIAAAGSGVSTTGATVYNGGSTSQSYRLQITDKPSAWSVLESAGSPGAEQIQLLALFCTKTTPVVGDFLDADDIVYATGGTRDADATLFGITAEGADAKGYSCTATSYRKLWFKFEAPLSTDLTSAQWITVTVTCY